MPTIPLSGFVIEIDPAALAGRRHVAKHTDEHGGDDV